MPVYLDGDPSSRDFLARAKCNSNAGFRKSAAKSIHVGLINNMPDGALQATERQFVTLLDSVAGDVVVRLSFYALPEVYRTDSGRRHIGRFYSGIENLWDSHLDGLIVTGTEPRTPNLTDEPYWGSLTKVIDWAEHNTHSSVWSCLAAHAAVLHLDGIARRRLSEKLFGVFECARASDHRLTAGGAASLRAPHSRWNDLPEDELTGCGYRVLTRAKHAGVDSFVKQRKSLFVFFQGHPEYEANTLLLEYRRDVGRYLRRDRDMYPPIPHGYFDRGAADALAAVRERALSDRREELLAEFPTAQIEKRIANTWRSAAACVYGNWLTYLCAEKERRLKEETLLEPICR
jgi:homoserine O-succinyltransferase/O-acetyltransferase